MDRMEAAVRLRARDHTEGWYSARAGGQTRFLRRAIESSCHGACGHYHGLS
jgi:hypothetical protein